MDVVYATKTGVVSDPKTGEGRAVNIGTHWPADDPVVNAYQGYFTGDPRFGLHSSRPLGEDGYPETGRATRTEAVVEQATAAPGEKRTRGKARG